MTLCSAGVVLLVVPVIEEIRVSGVVFIVGTKEEGGAAGCGSFPCNGDWGGTGHGGADSLGRDTGKVLMVVCGVSSVPGWWCESCNGTLWPGSRRWWWGKWW